MSVRTLIFRYALFAVIATFANLSVQRLILQSTTTVMSLALPFLAGP